MGIDAWGVSFTTPRGSAVLKKRSKVEEAFVDDSGRLSADVFVQTGGYAGAFTLGAGLGVWQALLRGELASGYTPPGLAGRDTFDFSARVALAPLVLSANDGLWEAAGYGALGALYTPDRRLWVRSPRRYGRDYYAATAVHATAGVGVEFLVSSRSHLPQGFRGLRQGGYLEANIHQIPFLTWAKNASTVSFAHAWTYTVGYRIRTPSHPASRAP